jgi:hypothetical protein
MDLWGVSEAAVAEATPYQEVVLVPADLVPDLPLSVEAELRDWLNSISLPELAVFDRVHPPDIVVPPQALVEVIVRQEVEAAMTKMLRWPLAMPHPSTADLL